MQRTAFVVVMLATSLVSAAASAQETDPEVIAGQLEERLRTLQRGTWELEAEVGQSYRRLAAIRMQMFENVDGARVSITHQDQVGIFYRLIEASYSIDGERVFHRRAEAGSLGRRDLDVFDGTLAPGEHTLSVVLRYAGDGGEVVRYLEGYRFQVRSSYSFTAPPGQRTALTVRSYERSIDVPYQHRLGLEYDRRVVPWSGRPAE